MGLTTGLMLLAGGLQAYGVYKSSRDQAAAEEYNAQVARQEASVAAIKGKLDADRKRKASQRLLSTQQALFAKHGLAFSGSSFDVFKNTAEDLELDAMIIEYNSKVDRLRAINEARLRESNAGRIRSTGIINTGATILKQSAGFLATQGVGVDDGTMADTGKTQSEILGMNTGRYR